MDTLVPIKLYILIFLESMHVSDFFGARQILILIMIFLSVVNVF